METTILYRDSAGYPMIAALQIGTLGTKQSKEAAVSSAPPPAMAADWKGRTVSCLRPCLVERPVREETC